MRLPFNNKTKKFWILLPTFLVAELCLWCLILFGEHEGTELSVFCFSSIVLAFVFALCFIKRKAEILLPCGGLLFTVCADSCLVLPQNLQYTHQVAGMSFFSVTQLIYFAYLFIKTENKTLRITHSIARAASIVIAEIAMLIVLKTNADALSALSVFYIANLAVSIVFAYMQGKKGLLFAIGLTLFICCDLFVGFSAAIGEYIHIAESSWLYKLVYSDFNFIWFFYLPSQVCIATYIALKSEKK